MILKILFVGDAVGTPGVEYLSRGRLLSETKKKLGAHLAVVNGENSADGNGMTAASAEALLFAGADVVTGGNHTARRARAGAEDRIKRLRHGGRSARPRR